MRLQEIEIENFKNVKHGKIAIPKKEDAGGASLLGIYGQNGTGKTAVVDALTAFRMIVRGKPIPDRFAGYIREGADASFVFTFDFMDEKRKRSFTVRYELVFRKQMRALGDQFILKSYNPRCLIVSEKLRYSCIDEGGRKIRMHDAAAASEEKGIWPKRFVKALATYESGLGLSPQIEKVRQILAQNKEEELLTKARFEEAGIPADDSDRAEHLDTLAEVTAKLSELVASLEQHDEQLRSSTLLPFSECHANGKSFLFQEAVCHLFKLGFITDENLSAIVNVISGQEIVISGVTDEGLLSSDKLPFYTMRNPINVTRTVGHLRTNTLPSDLEKQIDKGHSPIVAELQLEPYEATRMDYADVENVKRTLPYLNVILESIIPGLNVEMIAWGPDDDGIADTQWYSVRKTSDGETYRIPLANESHGVQRIVSWAALLVYVYNERDFIAVIDEIDAGIFEYLLGEILNIIEREGRGQLIFTCHNLRPLEMLDKSSVVFTTVNPENRYIRLKNAKPTNNLRDMYFRAITLDTQDETLYDYVSRARLGNAFSRAYPNQSEDYNERLANLVAALSAEDGAPMTEEEIELYRNELDSRLSEEGGSHGE